MHDLRFMDAGPKAFGCTSGISLAPASFARGTGFTLIRLITIIILCSVPFIAFKAQAISSYISDTGTVKANSSGQDITAFITGMEGMWRRERIGSARRLTGFPATGLTGMNLFQIPGRSSIARDRESFRFQNRLLIVIGVPFLLIQAMVIVLLAMSIVRRRRAEVSLRNQLDLFDNVMNNIQHFIFWKDENLIYRGCSESFARVAGLKREEIVGKSDYDLSWTREQSEGYRNCDREVLKAGVAMIGIEETQKVADGSDIHVMTSKVPMYHSDGTLMGVMGSYIDITSLKQAQERLQESETRFQMLFREAPISYQSLDKDGCLLDVNRQWLEMMGYRREEVIGHWFGEYMPAENISLFEQGFHHFKETGEVHGVEFELVRKNGEMIRVLLDGRIRRDSQGNGLMTHCTLYDVTERHRADRSLRESESRFRSLVEDIPDIAVQGFDLERRVIFWNRASEKVFGYSREEAAGQRLEDLILPEEGKDSFIEAVGQWVERGIPMSAAEATLCHKDGSEKTVYSNHIMYQTSKGEKEIYSLVVDLSERRQAQDELKRLATAIEQASEMVVITGVDGTIQYTNPAFERITGYTRGEALGGNPRMLKSGRHTREFYENLWMTIRSGVVWSGRIHNKRKDETMYEEEVTISPVRGQSGEIVNFVAVMRDVTHEASLENQLRHSQKMQAIGQLAGGIAHDFNNILSGIIGYTDLVIHELPRETRVQEHLAQVMKAGRRATDLVKQILMVSRQTDQTMKPLNLQLLVKEALKLMRGTLPATIDIQTHFDMDCPPVMADPSQIHQVIINLCTNAYHAMRENGGRLDVRLVVKELDRTTTVGSVDLPGGRYAQLLVRDDGHGMDTATLARIFEPYFTTKGLGEGTGLGLATVHGIVRSHKGAIAVGSQVGVGSSFEVLIPLCNQSPQSTQSIRQLESAVEGHERVMLIDDEETIVDLGKMALERLGYHVTANVSSVEALEIFRLNPDGYDLVVTDLAMPHLTGIDLSAVLMKIRPSIPIFLCTGFSEVINEVMAKEMGIREFVMKPIIPRELAGAIRRVLDGKSQ